MPPDIGSTPQFEAPTIATLCKQIYERPLWMVRECVPLEVDHETWQKAFDEMKEIQERQGRCVVAADWVDRQNFLLRGLPVVSAD